MSVPAPRSRWLQYLFERVCTHSAHPARAASTSREDGRISWPCGDFPRQGFFFSILYWSIRIFSLQGRLEAARLASRHSSGLLQLVPSYDGGGCGLLMSVEAINSPFVLEGSSGSLYYRGCSITSKLRHLSSHLPARNSREETLAARE
jgi:hypothetical protein